MSATKSNHYCAKCVKRSTCKEPCRPVELYLEQATAPHLENRGDLPREFVSQSLSDIDYPAPKKTKRQLIIEMFFIDRRKQAEICLLVGCDRFYVSRTINQERKIR